MDTRLRRLIIQASQQTGIAKSQGLRIYSAVNGILLEMMREAHLHPPNASSKRIFLRNIGTYDVSEKVIYAINNSIKNETIQHTGPEHRS